MERKCLSVLKRRPNTITGCTERQKYCKTGGYTRKGNHINLSGLYTLYSEHGAKSKRGNYFTYIEHAEEEYGQDEEIRHDLKNNMGKIRKILKGI